MKHPPKNQKIMGKKAEVEKTLGGGRKIKKSKRDEDDLEKQRLRKVIDESELLYSKPEGTVFLYILRFFNYSIFQDFLLRISYFTLAKC